MDAKGTRRPLFLGLVAREVSPRFHAATVTWFTAEQAGAKAQSVPIQNRPKQSTKSFPGAMSIATSL
jgi:hypothetical protein